MRRSRLSETHLHWPARSKVESHRRRLRYLLDLLMVAVSSGLRSDRSIAVTVLPMALSAVVGAVAGSRVAEAAGLAVVLRFGEERCRSSPIVRHCLMAVARQRGLGSHCDEH